MILKIQEWDNEFYKYRGQAISFIPKEVHSDPRSDPRSPDEDRRFERMRRLKPTKSKLVAAIQKISGFVRRVWEWLKANPAFKNFVSSIWFDVAIFSFVLLLFIYLIPCNKIPGLAIN